MMSGSFLVKPSRVRRVPSRFSWLDHRLVRQGHLRTCGHDALALYLFLVVVGDANGMSWYSPGRICLELGMDQAALEVARGRLEQAGLVAYAAPFYQVLEVPDPTVSRVAGAQGMCVLSSDRERGASDEERRALIEKAFGKGCQA